MTDCLRLQSSAAPRPTGGDQPPKRVKTEVSHPVGAAPKWSPTEDAKLLRIMKKVEGGNGWSWLQVATAHGTRSSDACRNRYVASDAHKAYLASIGRQLTSKPKPAALKPEPKPKPKPTPAAFPCKSCLGEHRAHTCGLGVKKQSMPPPPPSHGTPLGSPDPFGPVRRYKSPSKSKLLIRSPGTDKDSMYEVERVLAERKGRGGTYTSNCHPFSPTVLLAISRYSLRDCL